MDWPAWLKLEEKVRIDTEARKLLYESAFSLDHSRSRSEDEGPLSYPLYPFCSISCDLAEVPNVGSARSANRLQPGAKFATTSSIAFNCPSRPYAISRFLTRPNFLESFSTTNLVSRSSLMHASAILEASRRAVPCRTVPHSTAIRDVTRKDKASFPRANERPR